MNREVRPADIEAALFEMWEALAKTNKMRACLFNLIVFHRVGTRTPYIQNIVQTLVEKFPCRVLFISEDERSSPVKTHVSVLMPQGAESNAGCEQIEISASRKELEKVASLTRSHILPDLPITLLWAENPAEAHLLFEPLAKLAGRIIFDSECASNLAAFSRSVRALHESRRIDIADLNWARIAGWRDLLACLFATQERVEDLKQLATLDVVYNARPTESFCHLNVQSLYLEAWLKSRLKGKNAWKSTLRGEVWEKIGSGTILKVRLTTQTNRVFECTRIKERYHFVNIQVTSPESCELPFEFMLGKTATGQSLVKEICMKGTSNHYLAMLQELEKLVS